MTFRPFVPAVLVVAMAGLALPSAVSAQHQASIGLAISVPRGAFDENTDTGFGLGGGYMYALDPAGVVSLGATGSFLNYGNVRRRTGLSSTIPDIRVDVETRNDIAFFQGALQLRAPTGAVQPYLVGTGGFGVFWTTTSLEDPLTDQPIISDTNQSDATLVYGGGVGLQVKVWEGGGDDGGISAWTLAGDDGEPTRAWIDVGARYLKGGDVEYLREGTLLTDDGEIDIDQRLVRSEIELVQWQVGLTVTF